MPDRYSEIIHLRHRETLCERRDDVETALYWNVIGGTAMKLLVCALATLLATPATAQQPPCATSGKIEKNLAKQYGETVSVAGLETNGSVMFFLSNPETGTFSVIIRSPQGRTCLVMSGTGYEITKQPKAGKDL